MRISNLCIMLSDSFQSRTALLVFALSLLLGAFSAIATENAEDKKVKLRFGLNGDVPSALDYKGHEFSGLYASAYACILSSLDVDYDLTKLPLARLERMLEQGKLDLGVLLSSNSKRDLFAFRSDAVSQPRFVLFTKGLFAPDDFNLSGWEVATVRGSVFERLVVDDLKARAIGTVSWTAALKMLAADRVDAVYMPALGIVDAHSDILTGMTRYEVKAHDVGFYVSRLAAERHNLLERLNVAINQCIHKD